MKRIAIYLLILVSILGCRKGDEDPIVSFRSRENRLIGEWLVVGGEVNGEIKQQLYDNDYSYSFTATYSKDDVRYVYNSVTLDIEPNTQKGYTEFEFEEDGDFSRKSSYAYEFDSFNTINIMTVSDGEWKFMSKNSEYKNKERVEVELEWQTVNYGSDSYQNPLNQEIEYRIIELSKNQLKMEYEMNSYNDGVLLNEEGFLVFERD